MSGLHPITTVERIASAEDGAIAIGPFGSAMKADLYVPSGVPVVRGTNIGPGRSITGDFVFIAEETAQRLKRSLLKPGDLFFPHRGAIGEVGIIREGWPTLPIMSSSLMRLRVDSRLADSEFVFWYFKSDAGRHEILQYASTVGTPGIGQPLTSLRAMQLPLPPLPEQREIAGILGALDDKIEVNRKASALLEEMARALYRSWFVSFDPVTAAAEGRPLAHLPPELAALFPTRFQDNGLPEGWREGTLSDLIAFNPKESLKKGAPAPYLDMKALPTSGMTAEPPILREFASGTKFREGDTLLARITPCLENGKTALVEGLGPDVVGWGSTEFIVMRAWPGIPRSLPYCVARDAAFRDEAIATMTGSSGRQRADEKRIAELPHAIPPQHILAAFGDMTLPWFNRVREMGRESQTLAALRDSLLPRLMSGALRVGAARAQVEAVV